MSLGLSLLALPLLVSSGETDEPAPSYLMEAWRTDRGLPQNSVAAIVQTRDGYLWLGTFGGLARFDGVRFTVFDISNTPELATNRILSLLEDSRGVLWIGTQGSGVTSYAQGVFTHHGDADGAPEGDIWAIAEGEDGVLWFGGVGLTRFEAGRFEPCLPAELSATTYDIHVDGPEDLWLGTHRGVLHYVDGSTRVYTTEDGLPQMTSRLVDRDLDGTLWVSTGRGLAILRDGRFEPYETDVTELPVALTDAEGRRWVAGRGLYRFDGFAEREPFEPVSLPLLKTVDVRSLASDREGNLWIGTNGEGLVRIRRSPYSFLDARHGIDRAPILVHHVPGLDEVWIGLSGGGGIVRSSGGSVEPAPELPSRAFVGAKRRLFVDREGVAWIFNDTHIRRYGGDRVDELEHGLGFVTDPVHDAEGRIWFGSRDYLCSLRGMELETIPLPDGRTGPVWVYPGEADRYWLVTGDGIARFEGGVIEFLPIEELPKGDIRGVHEEEGVLWIATYGNGLGRYADGQLVMFTEVDGLPDDSLGGLLSDGRGQLWINSNRGVFSVDRGALEVRPADSKEAIECRQFGTGEGNGGSACRTADGRLWFPTLYGVAIVDPLLVVQNQVPPQVAIEKIELAGEELDLYSDIVIPPGKSDLVVEYTGLSFTEPAGVLFRYRLAGYDDDWIAVGPRRRAYYTNIPPGSYRFEVSACNEEGVWNEVGAAIDLELQPFFYQTRWFLAVGLALVAAGLFAFYKARTRSIRRRNVALRTEIQERERAEVALRESEERYRLVAEAATDSILTIDEHGRIVYANPATERIFGHAPEDCVGRTLDLLLPEPAFSGFIRATGSDLAWEGKELVGRHDDGHDFPIEVSLGVLHPHNGNPWFTGIIRDITERRRTEEERLRLEERLRESKKMEAMGRLAGGISHDFNNILTALINHAEFLEERLRKGESEDALEHVDEIQKCTDLAFSLTNQLLAFSRSQVVQPTLLDPSEILTGLEPMLRRLIREDIELTIRAPAGVGAIRADVGQLEQIFMNLVLNGSDAMPNGGELRVEIAALVLDEIYAACNPDASEGPHMLISVTDTGLGIPKEVIPHLFEPFFTTKAIGHGTGLGLASVHGIVQQSGGHITVTSEPRKGTTFRVYLPRQEMAELEAYEVPQLESVEDRTLGGTETILVCDDYDAVRRATQMILGNHGYRVLSANGPEEALRLAEEHPEPISLLITDVVMPGMNGPELAEKIGPLQPDIRVLYVSGYTSDVIIHEGVADRGTSFLQKPFAFRELLRRIRELLDAPVQA